MQRRAADRLYRDGCCRTGPEDLGSHTICAVVSAEFLEFQQELGNDLSTPVPQFRFPGLKPGDRWCVTAINWLRALEVVPFEVLREYAVDVPADPGALGG